MIDPLWCAWFTGFSDGEGYFQIDIKKHQIGLSFAISLREDDREILFEIQNTLGIGRVYHIDRKADRHTHRNASNQYRFMVRRLDEISRILIPIFDLYPLRAKKKFDYYLWREAAVIMHKKAHLTEFGKGKILSLRDQMKTNHIGPINITE